MAPAVARTRLAVDQRAGLRGFVDYLSRTTILGWAANEQSPNEAVNLTVLVNGSKFGRVAADIPSENLRKLFPGSTGYYAFRFEFVSPLSVFETHHVEVVFTTTGQPVPNGKQVIQSIGRDAMPRARQPASLIPVLVTSTGRAGSSLLMSLLKLHPAIAVAGEHPYETLLLSYYALALRTLASQADRSRSMAPDSMFGPNFRFLVGYNPFNQVGAGQPQEIMEYWNGHMPQRLAHAFADLIDDYYGVVGALQQKTDVRYFAEKGRPDRMVWQAAKMMFGTIREIVLVRDPRDILCSYKSFWNTQPDTAIGSIAAQMETLLTVVNQGSADVLLVRYEDLVSSSETAMERIGAFLDTHPGAAQSAPNRTVFEKHGTSGSPERSVGRWRQDLNPEEIALCSTRFRAVLEGFGYAS